MSLPPKTPGQAPRGPVLRQVAVPQGRNTYEGANIPEDGQKPKPNVTAPLPAPSEPQVPAQAGSIRAWSTSRLWRFLMKATTPAFPGAAFGNQGSARRALKSAPAAPSQSPRHYPTTQSRGPRLGLVFP